MNAEIQKLLDQSAASHKASGTDVRCPTCGMGRGKFCRENGAIGKVVIHAERVALSNR